MYASIFGNLTVIIQRLYLQTSKQHEDLRLIRDFVHFYKIPHALKENLENHILHESHFVKVNDLQAVSVSPIILYIIKTQALFSANPPYGQRPSLLQSHCLASFLPVNLPINQECCSPYVIRLTGPKLSLDQSSSLRLSLFQKVPNANVTCNIVPK